MTTRLFARLSLGTATLAAGLLVSIAVASPAFAADAVRVDISGVASSTTAGSRTPDSISVQFRNEGTTSLTGVHGVITVRLSGAPADAVHVQRALGGELPAETSGDGTFTF